MIELDDIHKVFNQGRHNEYHALKGITLSIAANRVTAFCGPSGSGKSTLLTLIGCMARPTRGRVRLEGRDISALPERFLTEVRLRTFGFVFQQYHLINGLSARDNVMLPAYPLGGDWRVLQARADMLLDTLRLGHRSSERVEWLSGGEQQRVAIARALINDPQVLVADEPTANLDTALSQEFMEIVRGLREQGRTILLTSHDPMVYESPVVDCVVRLRDGHLVEGGR